MGDVRSQSRPPRDEYYMRIAYDVARRSTCSRRQIGAVIVTGDVIVSTGYNGNPRGMPHCDMIGCIRDELNIPSGERMEICTGVHAEMNALIFAGPQSRGGTLYTTIVPCNTCAKMIINAGVKRVVYCEGYPDLMGYEILRQSGVPVDRVDVSVEKPQIVRILRPEKATRAELTLKDRKSIEEMKAALKRKFEGMTAQKGEESLNDRAVRLMREKVKGKRK